MMKIKARRFFLDHFCNNLFIDISVNQLPFSRLSQFKLDQEYKISYWKLFNNEYNRNYDFKSECWLINVK